MVDAYQILATPVIWTPEQDDFEAQVEAMMIRSMATRDFLDGQLTPDQFENALAETGWNPYECADTWNEGYTFT